LNFGHQHRQGADSSDIRFLCTRFHDFMRAESVREGEKVIPLTKAEDAAILANHAHAVVYRQP
jgi:hypothetical protein